MENFTYEISIIKKPTPDSSYGRLIASITLEHSAEIFLKMYEIIDNETWHDEFHTIKIDIHRK